MFDQHHHITISLDPQQFDEIRRLLVARPISAADQAALDQILATTRALLKQVQGISTIPPTKEHHP
jgi:hypothetical protein